jgi:hypothetical protein
MFDFSKLDPEDYTGLNAKLQKKKNALRQELSEKGILKREGQNNFDKYSYFSEAQYKALFTQLFAKHGLELKFTELDYIPFEGTEKQANGRLVKDQFDLIDIDTGFYESSVITGEGLDKGDKAGYKADTGALKYYLANTFLVATGDDPETESPEVKASPKKKPEKDSLKATENQIATIKRIVGDNLQVMLDYYKIDNIEDLTIQQASEIIRKKGTKI